MNPEASLKTRMETNYDLEQNLMIYNQENELIDIQLLFCKEVNGRCSNKMSFNFWINK